MCKHNEQICFEDEPELNDATKTPFIKVITNIWLSHRCNLHSLSFLTHFKNLEKIHLRLNLEYIPNYFLANIKTVFQTIPNIIKELAVEIVKIKDFTETTSLLRKLREAIGKLNNLTCLKLLYSPIVDENHQMLQVFHNKELQILNDPLFLFHLQNLEIFEFTMLGHDAALFHVIRELPMLTTLKVKQISNSNNHFPSVYFELEEIKILFNSQGKSSNLKTIESLFNINELEQEEALQIFNQSKSFQNIDCILLGCRIPSKFNKFIRKIHIQKSVMSREIIQDLETLSFIKTIHISGCYVSVGQIQQIIYEIAPTIENITIEDVMSFLARDIFTFVTLSQCPNLKTVKLHNLKISFEQDQLKFVLKKCKKITNIQITMCGIDSFYLRQTLKSVLNQFPNIEAIDIHE
jgi:hypothetical protein